MNKKEIPFSCLCRYSNNFTALDSVFYSSEDSDITPKEKAEKKKFLLELFLKLSPRQSDILTRRYINKESGIDMARSLGISEGRVSQLIKSSINKLKKICKKENIVYGKQYRTGSKDTGVNS